MSPAFLIFFCVVVLFSFVIIRGAPYVPSRRPYLKRALKKLYKIGPGDVLVDVGSGDGVVIRMAAQLGATRAIGYELNPLLVVVSKLLSLGNPTIVTKLADFWFVELPPELTVVYVFMVKKMSRRLEKKIQNHVNHHKKPVSVIAYGIPFVNRQPDQTLEAYFLYRFQPLQPSGAPV